MKLRLRYICLLLALAAVPCRGQTSVDLVSKYGPPVQSYEIRPSIFMTAKYAADGQVCEMMVEKRHVRTSGTIDLDETFLSTEESGWIVDELAPAAKRGKKLGPLDDNITIFGDNVVETVGYENASITYYVTNTPKKGTIIRGGTAAIVITWKNRPCKQG